MPLLRVKCTLRLGDQHRIKKPRSLQIGLQLLLPGSDPRGVMALGHPDAAMAEQHRNSV